MASGTASSSPPSVRCPSRAGRTRTRRRRSTSPRRCSTGARPSASTPRAPARATAGCTAAAPAWRGWRCRPAPRSCPSPSTAPTGSQPVDSKLVHPHKIVVEFGEPVPVDAVAHLASAGQKRRALTDLVMERVAAMSGQEPAGRYNDHQSPIEWPASHLGGLLRSWGRRDPSIAPGRPPAIPGGAEIAPGRPPAIPGGRRDRTWARLLRSGVRSGGRPGRAAPRCGRSAGARRG